MTTLSEKMCPAEATTYYEKDNYYMKDSQVTRWYGSLAKEFGLDKEKNIDGKDFYAILNGLDPSKITNDDVKEFKKLDKEKEDLEKKINKWKKSNNIKDFDKKNNPFKNEIDAFNIKKISLEKEINKRNGLEKLEVGSKVTVGDRGNIGTIKQIKNEKVTVHFLNSKTGKEVTKTFDKNLIYLAEYKSGIKLFKDTKNEFGLTTKERSGFDVTNSAPKSISILALTQGKDELLEAHRKANTEVLKYIEKELVQYRINSNGKREKVDGENMIASSFEHYTSRAVSRDTAPDPQIHTHNFIANIVKGADGKYRSMEPPEIYKKQMALGQIYQNALAKEIEKLGYEIEWRKEKKGNYTFEVKGMEEAIEQFSKRTVAIKEHIATLEAERGYKLSKKEIEIAKNEIRVPKTQQKMENLQNDWNQQIKDSNLKIAAPDLSEEKKIKQFNTELIKKEELEKIISDAYKIVEDKESVLNKTNILHEALKDSKGRYTVDDVLEALDNHKEINKMDKHNYASYELEAIEKNIISKYETSKGALEQIAKKEDIENFLNKFNTVTAEQMEKGEKGMKADQKEFIKEVLTNKDQITLIQGDAGTGKTHAIKELNNFIKENLKEEYQVIGIAPTAQAVGELQEKANIDGKTVAKFLMEDDLKTQYKFVENEVIKERKIGEFTESEVKKLNFSDKELKWLKKQESEFGLEMKSSLHFAKDSIKSGLIRASYHIPIVRWVNALSTDKTFRNEYIGREGAVYKQTDIKRTLWDKFVTKKMESTTFTTKLNRNTGEITKTLTKIDKEGNVTTVNLSNKDNSKFSIGYKSREDHEFTKVMKKESYVAKVKEKIEMEKKPRLIIVDESSMLSTKDMNNIISKLKTDDKLVFVGDKKQFKSVQQGSFFEHLQNVEKSLLGKVTEMTEKTRQKSKLTKDVVKDVENSKALDAIEKIQNKGNFFEINNSARLKEKFANNVISDLKNGKDTLALVSTNVQKEELNHKIRDGLIKNNIVKGDAKILESFVRIRNNDFDKKQIDNYEIGNTLKANKMLGDIKSGVDYKIVDIKKDDKKITVELPDGNQKDLKIEQLLEMEQYKSKKIEVKEGDKIIFNKNQGDFRNGTVAKITKIEGEKITVLANNKEKEFNYKKDKHFEYGYATTLHKSQGMDGKEVHLLSDGLKNKNAFYVAVTRAVDNIKVYAKDKDELSRGADREQIKENIGSKKEEILNGINSLKTQQQPVQQQPVQQQPVQQQPVQQQPVQQQPVQQQPVQQQPVTKKDLQEKIEALKNNSNIEKNISVEKTSEKDISKEEKKQSIVSYAKTENLEKAIANLPKEKINNIDLSKVSLSKDDGKNIKEIVSSLSKNNGESLKIDNEKINVKEMNQQISRSR